MEANTISVLRQLSENPQLIGQLQSLLSVLSASGQSGTAAVSTGATTMSTATANTTSSSSTMIPSSSITMATCGGGVSSPALATNLPLARTQQQKQQQQRRQRHEAEDSTRLNSHSCLLPTKSNTPAVSANDVSGLQASCGPAEAVTSGVTSFQRYEQLAEKCSRLQKQLEEKTQEALGAAQRVSQLEKETARLIRRVEQLVNAVEGQKQKLEECETKHELEQAEMARKHEKEMQAKVAQHEEELKRLMSAQHLAMAAAQYEHKINTAAQNLSPETTPANKVLLPAARSSVKQQHDLQINANNNSNIDKNNNCKKNDETVDEKVNSDFARRVLSVKRERDNTSNSLSAYRRTRRTPRTPSPTVADRVAAAASQSKKTPQSESKLTSENTKLRGLQSVATASPVQVTSAVTSTTTCHQHHSNNKNNSQQRTQDATKHVESKFIAQYGAAAFPPVPPAPLPLSSTAKSSLATLSRTPRKKGQSSSYNLRQPQRHVRSGHSSGTSSVVAGPTRSPSPVNPKRGAEQPRCFVVTSLTEEERARVKAAVAAVGQHGVVIESDFEEPPPFTATHIIVRGPPRSMKALCGVVASKWLVQPEYIYASRDAGFWLDEYEEGGLRCFPPPLKCQRFLLTMPDGIVKEKLEQVIEYGGGEVVRPAHDGRSYDQGVVVIASGDDLLRFATRVE